mgnify:FL=1
MADSDTVPATLSALKDRFGLEKVVLVGDRAMITETHADSLKTLGFGFISALRSAQIRTLARSGYLQLSLFDEQNLVS